MPGFSRPPLVCMLLLASVGAVNAAPVVPSPSVEDVKSPIPAMTVDEIKNDPRLQPRRTITAIGVPMGELLKRLEGEGIALTCSVTCRDQKIQLRFKDRPVHEIMTALAEMLPGAWQKRGEKQYELVMDSDALDKRRRWWLLFERARSAGLQAYRDQALKAMRGGSLPSLGSEGGEPVDLEAYEEVKQRSEFFGALPPDLQERIADNLNDKILFMPQRDGAVGSQDDEVGVDVRLSELPTRLQETIRNKASGMAQRPVNIGDPTIRFSNNGIALYANITGGDRGVPRGMISSLTVMAPPSADDMSVLAELDQRELPAKVAKLGDKAPLLWKQLAKYQEGRVWENEKPTGSAPRRGDGRRRLRPQELAIIAEIFDSEFVSDYYSQIGAMMPPDEEKKFREHLTTLRSRMTAPKGSDEVLNSHVAEFDLSWKRVPTGIVLVRNNRWYRDDRLEVPAPYLRRVLPAMHSAMMTWSKGMKEWGKQKLPGNGGYAPATYYRERLDIEADIHANLTPWQIANGLQWAVPEEEWVEPTSKTENGVMVRRGGAPFGYLSKTIQDRRIFLPFYRRLDSQARDLLLRRQLPFAGLSLAVQQDVLRLSGSEGMSSEVLATATVGPDGGMRRLVLTPKNP